MPPENTPLGHNLGIAATKNISKNKAIVISTHILEEVEAVCSRAMIIADGKLLANETPTNLEKQFANKDIISIKVFNKINKLFNGKLRLAKEKDWRTEYLDSIISIKTVKNVKEGVNHILKYGTMHTDSIITNNKKNAQIFLNGVNSSIAMHNVSTQFADGGEFGFGGEIGISTNKLPPRGPVGINQLTSYKYLVSGKGIIRP
mgnify:CR=1 FL=1